MRFSQVFSRVRTLTGQTRTALVSNLLDRYVRPQVQSRFRGIPVPLAEKARDKGIMLWEVIPAEEREAARRIASPYRWLSRYFTEELILQWIKEVNPPIAELFVSDEAWRAWYTGQCNFIRKDMLG